MAENVFNITNKLRFSDIHILQALIVVAKIVALYCLVLACSSVQRGILTQ